MKPEARSRRGITTHVSLNVEPSPERPLVMRFEMNDDGCQSPGDTLGRAILAAYPSGLLELLLLDLIEHCVLSDQYGEACEYLDPDQAEGIDKIRKRLVGLAGYWQRHRDRFYDKHKLQQQHEAQGPDGS